MIPGSNLLKTALRVIAKQTILYEEFVANVTNAAGIKVPTYSAPVSLMGSFQPIDSRYYEQMGLDQTKVYAMWYDPMASVRDIQRDRTGDKITYGGHSYVALSNNDWKQVDNWASTLFVRVPS